MGQVQALGNANALFAIDGPSGRGDNQADDFAPGGAFCVDGGVGDRKLVPFVGVVGLDLVPLEGDARPAGSEVAGGVRGGVAFYDTEAAVGDAGGACGGVGEKCDT